MKVLEKAKAHAPGLDYGIVGIALQLMLYIFWITCSKLITFPRRTSPQSILFMALAIGTTTIVGVYFGSKSIQGYTDYKKRSVDVPSNLLRKNGLYVGIISIALTPPLLLEILGTMRGIFRAITGL